MAERSARTPGEKLLRTEQRIKDLERRPVRAGRPRGGTPESRDAYYGMPATVAEQVELANKRPLWFRMDRGWEESYYAPAGSPGLEVRGLAPGAPAGWYPTGHGPRVLLEAGANTTAAVGSYVTNWAAGAYTNDGGEFFFYGSTGVRLLKPGRFDVMAWTNHQTGSGVMDYHFRKLNADGQVVRTVHRPVTLMATFLNFEIAQYTAEPALANEQFALWVQSGTCLVHHGGVTGTVRGNFVVEYVGPHLA